jgi:hypothetical protein
VSRSYAAGPWRTDEPPKDGSCFLGIWDDLVSIARWGYADDPNSGKVWTVTGGWRYKERGRVWVSVLDRKHGKYAVDPPDRWAPINLPQ